MGTRGGRPARRWQPGARLPTCPRDTPLPPTPGPLLPHSRPSRRLRCAVSYESAIPSAEAAASLAQVRCALRCLNILRNPGSGEQGIWQPPGGVAAVGPPPRPRPRPLLLRGAPPRTEHRCAKHAGSRGRAATAAGETRQPAPPAGGHRRRRRHTVQRRPERTAASDHTHTHCPAGQEARSHVAATTRRNHRRLLGEPQQAQPRGCV